MQTLYLIRHARPDIPLGKTRCIGTTDLALGTLGKLQAVILGEYMKAHPISAVYCSPLSRAIQTANSIAPNPVIIPDLREMDAGDWDGLYFDEIRERWLEVYEKRGIDPNYPIPGSEDAAEGQQRFLRAVQEILTQQDGHIAIVAHITVIQSFLCYVLGTDAHTCRNYPIGYTGITTVQYEGGRFVLCRMNEIPAMPLSVRLCEALLKAADAPISHCREVAEKAMTITRELAAAGVPLNEEAVRFGALLHDIARKEKNHPHVGAHWLKALGWPEIADIVRQHHDPENTDISEANIVFLADKIPVEHRFAASLAKCTSPEAKEAHARRYQTALTLKEKINSLCGKEIIP